MTVSREQLKRRKYLWGWEGSAQAGARTVHTPSRREDEQTLEIQTEEIAFSFIWDEKLSHIHALYPCDPTNFASLSAACTASGTEPLSLPVSRSLRQGIHGRAEKHGSDLNLPLSHLLSALKVLVLPTSTSKVQEQVWDRDSGIPSCILVLNSEPEQNKMVN